MILGQGKYVSTINGITSSTGKIFVGKDMKHKIEKNQTSSFALV